VASELRIGIAGLGTVGVGVIEILTRSAALLSKRSGRDIRVVAVSARDRKRDRGIDLGAYQWCDDPVDLARRDDVDVVVELIGGSDGPALALARECLAAGKGFVTANKALMAYHGVELAALAERSGVSLAYEAAVAGGIPIIKSLKEGLSGNAVSQVFGILNGTCNFILTKMEEEGLAFDDVLREAQDIGYAEADPSFDIDGHDTAHKAIILAMIAFNAAPEVDTVPVEGIRALDTVDIDYARELGYRIKLLGVARQGENGVEVGVYPAMVRTSHMLASVREATNAVLVEGNAVGEVVLIGAGAGRGPTASAVVGDIVDIARGVITPVLGGSAQNMPPMVALDASERISSFYMRVRVDDEAGVIADIAQLFADSDVSIGGLLQRGQAPDGGVYVVMTTHRTTEAKAAKILEALDSLDCVLEPPALMRIVD